MATNRPTRKPYFDRSIFPTGGGGAAIGIPAEVRRDQDLEPGKDGDTVDLEYDRVEGTLTVYLKQNE